ncbi:MAG: RHS repeat-associated core domain-containing protein, partial [Myxococcota bacterium]
WLANQTEWTDDAQSFYERSLGQNLGNGFEAGLRPSALYFASNIRGPGGGSDPAIDRGGWLKVDYGVSGNVEALTVRGQCADRAGLTCEDPQTGTYDARNAALEAGCECQVEQHYQYRWDELNRLAEGRRYDRGGSGGWTLQVRQRYRYDGANVRTLKQTLDGFDAALLERTTLCVYPGDFERRGVTTGVDRYSASVALGTETQYQVAGARIVWKGAPPATGFSRDTRITYAISDLLQSTAAVVDLVSGELLEYTTFHPNGARETHLVNDAVERFSTEPLGFTGKEADEEVGLIYFGERYLIPRLGRWASPDPLHVHAVGGGEALNSYHYVGGNLLQARDPLGLDVKIEGTTISNPQRPRQSTQVDGEMAREVGERDLFMGLDEREAALFQVRDDGFVVLRDPEGMTDARRGQLSEQAQILINQIEDDHLYVIHPLPVQDSGTPAWVQRRITGIRGDASLRVTSAESGGEEYDVDIRMGPASVARRSAAALTLASPERHQRGYDRCAASSLCGVGSTADPDRVTSRIPGETHIFYSTGAHTDRISRRVARSRMFQSGAQFVQAGRSGAVWHELGGHAELARRGVPHFHGESPMHEQFVEPHIERIQAAAVNTALRRAREAASP